MSRVEVVPLGVDGLLVRFDAQLSDAGNAAALAFYRDVLEADWPEVREVAPALTSVAVFFDALAVAPDEVRARIDAVLARRDWSALRAPVGRHWQVPVTFDAPSAPHLDRVAKDVGLTRDAAIDALCAEHLRVLALGFAPGQPYLGILPTQWDIPRQSGLTSAVEEGAVVVAVRQAIIFATFAPTGWWQVGWSGFRPFERGAEAQLHLSPGDLVQFVSRPEREVREMASLPLGGAEVLV